MAKKATIVTNENDEWMTPDEVAKYLKLKVATIYKWASQGKLKAASPSKKALRFRKSDIDEFMMECFE